MRSRARPWALAMFALAVVATLGARDGALPVPRVVPGEAPALVLLPAFAAAALVSVTGRAATTHELLSQRPMPWYDLIGAAAVATIAVAVWLIADLAGVPGDWLAATRNLLGYLGLALIIARLDLSAG